MPLLEIDIEQKVCEWAEQEGWLVAKLQWLSQTGWPDRTFMKNGIVAWIEFKRPGGRVSAKQKHWHTQMRRQNLNILVTDDVMTARFWLINLEMDAKDDSENN